MHSMCQFVANECEMNAQCRKCRHQPTLAVQMNSMHILQLERE